MRVANHERKSTRTKIDQQGKTAMFVGYADDHIGDVYRFIYLKTQHVILSRDAQFLNIMWKACMRKQYQMNQGLQIIDEDYEDSDSDDEDDTPVYRFTEEPIYRNREELPPLDQQRRLGLDIDMIGARETTWG